MDIYYQDILEMTIQKSDWNLIDEVGIPKNYGDYLFQECALCYEVLSLWSDAEFDELEKVINEVPGYYKAWIRIEPAVE